MNTALFEPLESRQMMAVTLGTNLIVNGDAETAPPLPPPAPAPAILPDSSTVRGWDVFGAFTQVAYGERGMPTPASPGPASRGGMLFAGGPSNTPSGTADQSGAQQTIDISSIAADVDSGRIKYDFSAFLGGYGHEKDNMKVTLVFDDRQRLNPPPGPSISGPTPAQRGGLTGLSQVTLSGHVPIGTRAIHVQLHATKAYGKFIDGFADNVELRLSSEMPMNRGIVRGRVMNDANVNGKLERGERGVSGALVFSDRNQNGRLDEGEPSVHTNVNGAYALMTAPGLNHIRQIPPRGFQSTGARLRKVLVNGGLTTVGHSFLATSNGVITGNVFADWNGNGKFDKNDEDEPRIGAIVYLDANNNGKLDANERRTRTDAKGNFSFVVPAGTHTVRQREDKAVFRQTLPGKGRGIVVKLPAGTVSKGNVFGMEPIPQ